MTDAGETSAAVGRLARATRRVVKAVAVLLPVVIGGLSLKDVTLASVVEVVTRSNAVIWRATIVAYFVSLIFGAYSDIDDQERVFRGVADGGRLPIGGGAFILLLALTGGFLAYSPTFEIFAAALATFWLTFALGWKYMVSRITKPLIASSRDFYANAENHAGLERLRVVEEFVAGRWQVARFAAGGAFVLALIGLAVASYLGVNDIPVAGRIDWETMKSLAMLVFVLAVEAWIWAKRIKMKSLLMGLDQLSDRYRFVLRA